MVKGAICSFAFFIFLFGCTAKMVYQPPPPPSQTVPLPEFKDSETSLKKEEIELIQKEEPKGEPKGELVEELVEEPMERLEEEVKEEVKDDKPREEKIELKSEIPVEPLLLPDIAIADLFLNSNRGLVVVLDNRGDGPIPLTEGTLKLTLDGQLKERYPLSNLFDQSFLFPKEKLTLTIPFILSGRHEIHACLETSPEVKESNQKNNYLMKILEDLLVGPDIMVRDLELSEDLELVIVLGNAGEIDLRKGVTLRIEIFVNDQMISEFNHFTSEVLKAYWGSRYPLSPPYRVDIGGISKVKVSISTNQSHDDVRFENNVLKRTFIVFPFKIGPQGREEFTFFISPFHSEKGDQENRIKAETRWSGGRSSLQLSLKGPGQAMNVPLLSAKSPFRIEFPLLLEKVQEESPWKVSVTNLIEKRVEGHVIIQHQ